MVVTALRGSLLAIMSASLLLVACDRFPETEYPNAGVVRPLVLVHGLGGSADSWRGTSVAQELESLGLEIAWESNSITVDTDVFVFSSSRVGAADIDVWADELGQGLARVTELTGSPSVVLIAASAGGVVARKYLVDHLHDHRVSALVTVASPHRGSPLALLAAAAEEMSTVDRGRLLRFGDALRGQLADFERVLGVPFDSKIYRQIGPEEEAPWLSQLNESPHPADVRYHFLRLESPDIGDALSLWMSSGGSTESASDVVAALLNLSGSMMLGGQPAWGDGIVPLERQSVRVRDPDGREVATDVRTLSGVTHQDLGSQAMAMFRAAGGHPTGVKAGITRGYDAIRVVVDLDTEFLSGASIDGWVDGESLPTNATVVRDGRAAYVRATTGPLPTDWQRVVVRLTDPWPEETHEFVVLRRAAAGASGPNASTSQDSAMIRITAFGGIPPQKPSGFEWDIGSGLARLPDVRFEVVGGEDEYLSEEFTDALSISGLNVQLANPGRPLLDSLVVTLWDDDRRGDLTLQNDLIGSVAYAPGAWPRGVARVSLAPIGWLDLEATWSLELPVHVHDDPVPVVGLVR